MELNQLKEKVDQLVKDGYGLRRIVVRVNNRELIDNWAESIDIEDNEITIED